MSHAARSRPAVIYDDDCGICLKAMRFVRACDWWRRLDYVPYPDAAERYPEVAAHELDEGMQFRHPDGRVEVAIDGVRATMLGTPPGLLVGWLLFIPPIRWAASKLYEQVAARRKAGACVIPPRVQ